MRDTFPVAASGARSHRLARWLREVLPRGLALFLGGFALTNLLGSLWVPGFDVNLAWLDLRPLPQVLADSCLAVAGLCLVAFALWPLRPNWRARLTLACALLLASIAGLNAIQFYVLLARGAVHTGMPVPLSLLISGAMALVGTAAWQALAASHAVPRLMGVPGAFQPLVSPARPSARVGAVLVVLLGCAVAFPLAQMLCFGKTDYRRPADVVVVLGARVYADGRPSDALADRVRTACRLYREGLAGKLICSGGPGDGSVSEPESMRRMAIELGVRPQDILLDGAGVNTQATVRDTGPLLRQLQANRVLVVSHFYHLPRIKLAYQRAGWAVYTVPAKESYWLRQMPYNLAREVAALWTYYLRPLAG